MNFAAEDFDEIAKTIAYERGINAAASGADRNCPAECRPASSWYIGYDEAKRLLAAKAA